MKFIMILGATDVDGWRGFTMGEHTKPITSLTFRHPWSVQRAGRILTPIAREYKLSSFTHLAIDRRQCREIRRFMLLKQPKLSSVSIHCSGNALSLLPSIRPMSMLDGLGEVKVFGSLKIQSTGCSTGWATRLWLNSCLMHNDTFWVILLPVWRKLWWVKLFSPGR